MSVQLSSEILERQFGPTAVDVLYQHGMERIIATRVIATGQPLEYSWVTFRSEGTQAFPGVHKAVLDGASMGAAFRSRDVLFRRDTGGTYSAEAPRPPGERFDAAGRATVVEVTVRVGPDAVPYADIFEVYSPAVSWPAPTDRIDSAATERLAAFSTRLASLN